VYAGAGGHTYTLPTITDVSPTSMVGMPFRIVNAGTGLLTVATDGTQLFNSRSGKATYVLMPGQEINMIAAKNASGTLFWAGSLSEPYPVAVAGLPTASAAGQGARAFVTDANATTFASIVAAGGSNKIPVWSDGANWLVG
uniref:hypothetical protein n=1 Tax=Phenylobacterium sp. TaxID=1871053 RepID=UPI00286B65EA